MTWRIGDRVQLGSPASVRWAYKDNTDIASYDVVCKVAAPGVALGKWIYPAAALAAIDGVAFLRAP